MTVLVTVGTDWAEERYGTGCGRQQCDSVGNCGYRLGCGKVRNTLIQLAGHILTDTPTVTLGSPHVFSGF